MACEGQRRGLLIAGGILLVISIAGIGIAYWLLSGDGEPGIVTENWEEVLGDKCGTGCSDPSYKPKTCVFNLTLEQLFTDTPGRIADGGAKRPVLVFNGVLPGPPLVVCEGDNVKVELKNRLSGNDPKLLGSGGFNVTTLHFHGIRQKQHKLLGTNLRFSWSNHGPWSDGVPMVTQCPVPAGKDFHYQFSGSQGGEGVLATFNNAPAGSYWYHSHVGNQRLNGAAGKLIVMPRKAEDGIVDHPENSLFLQEWYHVTTESEQPKSLLVNGKGKLHPNQSAPTLDEGETMEEFMRKYFMGRAVFFHDVQDGHKRDPRAQYEIFSIPEKDVGKAFRFRLISGIGQDNAMRVSIEDHSFKAIASDAIDIQKTDSLGAVWLAAGERYDILVQTKTRAEIEQHPSAYKINILFPYSHNPKTTFRVCSIAWLRYAVDETSWQTIDETFLADCKSMWEESFPNPELNPVPNDYTRWNSSKAIFPKDLRAKSHAPDIEQVLNTHYVNMTCAQDHPSGKWWCNFNNYQMPFPAAQTSGSVASSGYQEVPFLFQSPSNQTNRCGAICDKYTCRNQGPQGLSNCSHVLQQPEAPGDWFEVVLINQSPDGRVAHPIHQHGGWYNVIGQGQYPPTVNVTRELIIKNDTECKEGIRCLPRNLKSPVFKDSVQVPTNGYVIMRTPLDNPGTWIVHCHINYHVEHGMAMVFQVGVPWSWGMGPTEKVAQKNWEKKCF